LTGTSSPSLPIVSKLFSLFFHFIVFDCATADVVYNYLLSFSDFEIEFSALDPAPVPVIVYSDSFSLMVSMR